MKIYFYLEILGKYLLEKKGGFMLDFTYDIPTKIHFGKDALDYVGEEVKKYADKVLITYGGGSIKKMEFMIRL